MDYSAYTNVLYIRASLKIIVYKSRKENDIMEIETLKKIRTVFPGVFVVILAFYYHITSHTSNFLSMKCPENEISLSSISLPSCIILLIGIIYYVFSIRDILWKPLMKKIWDCIINGLLSIAELEDVSVNSKERDRVRKTVFYYFIDKDDTLKEKSKLIKFNGAILSCLVDAILILFVYIVIVVVVAIVKKNLMFNSLMIPVILFVFCIPSVFIVQNKHLKLVNDQIDFIKTNYSKECAKKMSQVIGKNGD